MATGGSADAHDAGFQAVEWPQEGRLMLMMLQLGERAMSLFGPFFSGSGHAPVLVIPVSDRMPQAYTPKPQNTKTPNPKP